MLYKRHENALIRRMAGVLNTPYITAVREGLTLALPVIVAGTLAVLVNSFPLPAYQRTMNDLFGAEWRLTGEYIYLGTFGVLSVVMALSIGHSLAEDYNDKHPLDRIPPSIASLITLSCVVATLEPTREGALLLRWLGVHGLLTAIATALASSAVLRGLMRLSFLRISFYAGAGSMSMSRAMSALLPAVLTILLFAGAKTVFKLFGAGDINSTIYHLLYLPFQNMGGDHLSTATIYGFARHLLWFMGVHGSNVLEPIMTEIYVPAIQNNIMVGGGDLLYRARENVALTTIFTKPFFDCYTSMGGAGSTLGLLIACLLQHNDQSTRKIARISILPSIFNINEILLFGLPVVLNPVFLIPFVLVPLLNTVIAFLALKFGLVPLTVHEVAWNIPVGANAWLATESWRGAVLQAVNLAVAVAVYSPFVSLDNHLKGRRFTEVYHKLMRIAVEGDGQESGPRLLSQSGPVGGLAAGLAADMRSALRRSEFFLRYQPQVNSDTGKVYGVESLLRWQHPTLGFIPPPVFVSLAEETGFIKNLGMWSLEQSIATLSAWRKAGIGPLVMSVNLSARQLADKNLPDRIEEMLKRYNVPVEFLKLEVTESVALTSEALKSEVLAELDRRRIKLAIDDFGMGHSSLTYLKKFPVASLKLDALLSRDVMASRSSCEIILSVSELCRSLGIQLIAEFVEDEKHLLKLRSLGCSNIQGYFYSPPLHAEEFFDFARQTHKAYGPNITPPLTCME